MDLLKTIEILKQFDEKIYRGNTGNPSEFAESLGVSETSLYRFIKGLREVYHVEINYSRKRKTYYYQNSQLPLFYILQILSSRKKSFENKSIEESIVKIKRINMLKNI